MNDGEMNDLLLLLNMEDEESEDEDYIPKEEGEGEEEEDEDEKGDLEDEEEEDEDDDDEEEEGAGGPRKKKRARPAPLMGYDGGIMNRASLKRSKPKKAAPKKGRATTVLHSAPSKRKGEDGPDRRREDNYNSSSKRRSEDKLDRRGPLVRLVEGDFLEVVVNAPDREDAEDAERSKRAAAPFHLDLPFRSPKVGFNSTLHNNYDAFNKDLDWVCAFCKNYSHHRTLGDLFGPFYVKGLKVCKKNYPEVVEGQVAEMALSPGPCPQPGGPKSKRTPKHESGSADALLLEAKKVEMGGCSPPSRFVPAATPARMLGRGGVTPSSPRIPLHSPLRGNSSSAQSLPTNAAPPSSSSSSGGPPPPSSEVSPPGTECWLHETCTLWSSGLSAVNSKLCGLEKAVLASQESICLHCGETGATVSCLARGCSLAVHVPCARLLLWTLDSSTFQSFCPKHAAPKKNNGNRKASKPSHYQTRKS